MEKWFNSATTLSEQVKTKSIFNCLLWMFPFLLIALVFVSFGNNKGIQHLLMFILSLLVIVILFIFCAIVFFAINKNKPELISLLRSEEHIYKMAALEKLGDQSNVLSDVVDVEDTTNPKEIDPSEVIIPQSKTESSIVENKNHE